MKDLTAGGTVDELVALAEAIEPMTLQAVSNDEVLPPAKPRPIFTWHTADQFDALDLRRVLRGIGITEKTSIDFF